MCLLQASWFIWEALGRTGVGGPGGFDWWPCRALQFERLWFRGGTESTTGQWQGQEKVAGPATSAPSEKPVCTQLLHKRQSWRLWNTFLQASVFLFSFLFVCITSDDLCDCYRCLWAWSVPCTDCHGVVGCGQNVGGQSTVAQDQKPMGKMLLGRGLDRKVGTCIS